MERWEELGFDNAWHMEQFIQTCSMVTHLLHDWHLVAAGVLAGLVGAGGYVVGVIVTRQRLASADRASLRPITTTKEGESCSRK